MNFKETVTVLHFLLIINKYVKHNNKLTAAEIETASPIKNMFTLGNKLNI